MVERECRECGAVFNAPPGPQRICSNACRKARASRVAAEWFATHGRAMSEDAQARKKAQNTTWRKANPEKLKGQWARARARRRALKEVVSRPCKYCGNTFEIHGQRKVFCSHECYRRCGREVYKKGLPILVDPDMPEEYLEAVRLLRQAQTEVRKRL